MRTTDDAAGHDRVQLAVVDDFEVVVAGVARLMEPFRDRVEVVELDANEPVSVEVDVALVDTFAQGEAHTPDLDAVLRNPLARRAAIYTWHTDAALVDRALERGFDGYLSKQLDAEALVDALERINAGEVVVAVDGDLPRTGDPPRQWPGRDRGLSEREAEVLVLITNGLTNGEIAELLFLSGNSIKTYVRSLYQKIGVDRRTLAVLWGVDHGFRLDRRRLDDWRHATNPEHPTPTP